MPLFDFLNNSIFNKTTPKNHDCTDSNCSGDRLYALNLTCQRCLKPYFFDCMAKLPEIQCILQIFNLNGANNQVVSVITKLQTLFNHESVFEFVCPPCKSDDTFPDLKLKYDAKDLQMKELKKELSAAKSAATIAKNENTSLEQQLSYSSSTSSTTTNKSDNLSHQQSIEDLQSRISSLESIIGDVSGIISKQISKNSSMLDMFENGKIEWRQNIDVLEKAHKSIESIGSFKSSCDDSNGDSFNLQQSSTNAITKTQEMIRNTNGDDPCFLSAENLSQCTPNDAIKRHFKHN